MKQEQSQRIGPFTIDESAKLAREVIIRFENGFHVGTWIDGYLSVRSGWYRAEDTEPITPQVDLYWHVPEWNVVEEEKEP